MLETISLPSSYAIPSRILKDAFGDPTMGTVPKTALNAMPTSQRQPALEKRQCYESKHAQLKLSETPIHASDDIPNMC